ncbi:hypothetical protein [Bdellovibrio bacteriovorus]|uniref:hypothetical protein n=1 Tax=Bdellovibrio bacteriovorus TaxID=959 RepID=UPI0035A6DEE7
MSSLVGHQIQQSEKVKTMVQDLVNEVTKLNSQLSGIRSPMEEFKGAGKQKIDLAGQFRGRPLHYPYMGTGAGRGPYVELEDGSVKLDLINGIGIHLMGHANPRVMAAAVRGSLADILTQGNLQPNNEYRLFTEKIVKLASKKKSYEVRLDCHLWNDGQ